MKYGFQVEDGSSPGRLSASAVLTGQRVLQFTFESSLDKALFFKYIFKLILN
jgi:hypothetical protein